MSRTELEPGLAAGFAELLLGHVGREFPYKLDHVLAGPDDVQRPSQLYPLFHGSYDWHSCVHSWWSLLTLLRLFPAMPGADRIGALADDSFTASKVAGECAYFQRPESRTFERPYGWAWLLQLHLESSRHSGRDWPETLEPLARIIAQRFADYLPILTYPVRSGAHFNTAFALVLTLEWAKRFDPSLAALIADRGRDWFLGDSDCQAWEPSGDDFLSPALCEAVLMAKILERPEFDGWMPAFLPRLASGEPPTLLTPARVSDRSDGKIAHLDGLNFSRAWCWRMLEPLLGRDEAAIARNSAERHVEVSLGHVADDYMGSHWLVSFVLLALLA